MSQYGWTSRKFLVVISILIGVSEVDGVLEFTCFSSSPRIYINGGNNMLIGGFSSGDDTDASVSFGRTSNTGTSSGLALPAGSRERDHSAVSARWLDLPDDAGVERIGAFYCNANKNGVDEQISTIRMSSASKITPRELSQTVSVYEQVTFDVDTDVDVTTLRWRHNGGNTISSLNGQMTYTIESVTLADAGVYECYQDGERSRGLHAIFQLIVRECPEGKWNLPSCDRDCPHCFNGGICDERSGQCVCAPGFSGQYCTTVYGRNKWGQDGQLQCSGSDDHGYGCQGRLFCLPHPYGCSCAAGFKGLDCDQECETDMYGANCKQQCHCATSDCLKDTGECDSGQCSGDWFGINCQEYCSASDPHPVTNLHVVSTNSDSISVEWDHYDLCPSLIQYAVEYELTNLDNCLPVNQIMGADRETSKRNTKSGLNPYSTYKIGVKAIRQFSSSLTHESTPVYIDQTTTELVPNAVPLDIRYQARPKNISVTWEEIPCGSKRGSGLRYDYRLKLTDGTIFLDWQSTTGTSASFTELTECSQYTFEVRAVNDIGPGGIGSNPVNTDAIAKFSSNQVINGVLTCLLIVMAITILVLALKIRSLNAVNKRLQNNKLPPNDRNMKSSGQDIKSVDNKSPDHTSPVTLSADGYAEYKVTKNDESAYQDLESTYQDLDNGSTMNRRKEDEEYDYVNESILKSKAQDTDDGSYENTKY